MNTKSILVIFILIISSLTLLSGCSTQENSNIINTNSDNNNNENSIINNLKTVPVNSFKQIHDTNINNPNFITLDVRTEDEYNSGHISKAINIDFYNNNFKNELNKLDKNKTYLIYCRSGHRAGLTLGYMKELGFKSVDNLDGGINSWNAVNYPLVR